MRYKILVKKLDRRYDGNDLFTHRLEFEVLGVGNRRPYIQKFIELRNYMWQRFGPSVETSLFSLMRNTENGPAVIKDPKWAWSDQGLIIYVRDEALTEFLLMKDRYENV